MNERDIGKMILFHVWWYLQLHHMPSLNRACAIDIIFQAMRRLNSR